LGGAEERSKRKKGIFKYAKKPKKGWKEKSQNKAFQKTNSPCGPVDQWQKLLGVNKGVGEVELPILRPKPLGGRRSKATKFRLGK